MSQSFRPHQGAFLLLHVPNNLRSELAPPWNVILSFIQLGPLSFRFRVQAISRQWALQKAGFCIIQGGEFAFTSPWRIPRQTTWHHLCLALCSGQPFEIFNTSHVHSPSPSLRELICNLGHNNTQTIHLPQWPSSTIKLNAIRSPTDTAGNCHICQTCYSQHRAGICSPSN